MNAAETALQHALMLQQEPERLFAMQTMPLPGNMAQLLRIVGDSAIAKDQANALAMNSADLQKAAANYVHGICLFAGSDALRCLGLNDAQDLRLAKEHHRLLMKWLHPDRNPDQQALAERVNQAWTQLKSGRFNDRLPKSNPWQAHDVSVQSHTSSRFPLFLWVLLFTGLVLLALGMFWPEQEIYGEAELEPPGVSALHQPKRLPEETELAGLEVPAVDWTSASTPAPTVLPAAPEPVVVRPEPELKVSLSEPILAPQTKPVQIRVTEVVKPAPTVLADAIAKVGAQSAVVTNEPAKSADIAPSIGALPAASQTEAAQVLQAFVGQYQAGQLPAFMALFSANARNDRGARAAIAEDYGRLFAQSRKRSLDLSRLQWQQEGAGWRLNARYISKVQREGDLLPVKNKGAIELDFVLEGGRLKIGRIALK